MGTTEAAPPDLRAWKQKPGYASCYIVRANERFYFKGEWCAGWHDITRTQQILWNTLVDLPHSEARALWQPIRSAGKVQ